MGKKIRCRERLARQRTARQLSRKEQNIRIEEKRKRRIRGKIGRKESRGPGERGRRGEQGGRSGSQCLSQNLSISYFH